MADCFSHALHLAVRGLRVERGGRLVLRDVSFELARGQALWLRGPNGAGKSTLLRVLAGLLRHHDGDIVLSGGDGEVEAALLIHYLGYNDALKSTLTVAENLSFWGQLLASGFDGISGAGDVGAALARVGIADLATLPAAYLSAGQKKRLALARLCVAPRPLWLMDEPSLTLDQQASALMGDMMVEHMARGGMIVFASHTPLSAVAAHEIHLGMM
jgi:heme exporter protein A